MNPGEPGYNFGLFDQALCFELPEQKVIVFPGL
jgi:hypothetical protein